MSLEAAQLNTTFSSFARGAVSRVSGLFGLGGGASGPSDAPAAEAAGAIVGGLESGKGINPSQALFPGRIFPSGFDTRKFADDEVVCLTPTKWSPGAQLLGFGEGCYTSMTPLAESAVLKVVKSRKPATGSLELESKCPW